MTKAAFLGFFAAIAVLGGLAAPAATLEGCTKAQAVSAVNLTVDACQEISNFVPPTTAVGSVVGLLCQTVDQLAGPVEVVIDSTTWNAMKAQYLKTHGSLPRGMSAPPAASSP